MESLSPQGPKLHPNRQAVAEIDTAIHAAQVNVSEENNRLIDNHPDQRDLFYDEPTYNGLLGRQVGVWTADLEEKTRSFLENLNSRKDYLAQLSPVMASTFSLSEP